MKDEPTKRELWEHILKLTDRCLDSTWHAGYSAGHKDGYGEAMAAVGSEIVISDLIEEAKE